MYFKICKWLYRTVYKIKRKDCIFEDNVQFGKKCIFEGHNLISRNSYLRNVKMGYGSYCGNNCYLTSTKVGRYSCLGPNITIAIGRHPTTEFISIHPAFFSKHPAVGFSYVGEDKFSEVKYAINTPDDKYAVKIGNDVWIGANVTILDGVTIGDGSIVAAGAVVTKDIPPYSIYGGVPAKELKKRFSRDYINELIRIKWWDKDIAFIEKHGEFFEKIDEFMKVFKT